MIKGTLNVRRNPDVPAEDGRACVFTFFDDPGEGATESSGRPRSQCCAVAGCEAFMRDQLQLPADLVMQLASSLEFGENSTMEVELADDVYARYFRAAG